MYDNVLRFPARAKFPVYELISAATGTLTYTSATWSVTANDGTAVGSGSVDASSGSGTSAVTVYKNVDGPTLALSAGLYILHFETLATGSDAVARIEPYDYVLDVPGTVTHSIFPTAADLQVFLLSEGLISNPPKANEKFCDLFQTVADAKEAFEQDTGWTPFLSETQTRTFNPDTVVVLDGGLLTVSSLTIGKYGGNAGTVMTVGTDYVLTPPNAPNRGKPYASVRFLRYAMDAYRCQPYSVEIVGEWGFSATVDARAWGAVLRKGASIVIEDLIRRSTGGVKSRSETGVASESYFDLGEASQMMDAEYKTRLDAFPKRAYV